MANFFTDRSVENPGRYRLNPTGTTDVYDLTREEGTIYNAGTPLNAENLNDAMQDVIDQIPTDYVARDDFEADIDTTASAGTTDGDLYNAINAIGWVSNVISGSNLLVKRLLTKILETLKVDYVVEEGTSGGWTWRKWNSGIAEAWYRGNYGTVTLSTQLGTDIVSATMQLTFPFTFTAVPMCVISFEGSTSGYSELQYPGTVATTAKSQGFRLVRIGTQSISLQNCWFTGYVKGTWK